MNSAIHDTYTVLRHFADSWFLLAMFGFFASCILWAFRPGSRQLHAAAAASILREDAAPAQLKSGCTRGCPDCACKTPEFGK